MGLGKKQLEQLSGFAASIVTFGLAGFISMVYFTDWKAICLYIPYYNGQFKDGKKK